MPEPTAALRARILEALVAAPASFVRDDPESAAAHSARSRYRHDQHQYNGGCAPCCGEADTLADAVMAVLDEAFAPQRFLDPAPQMRPEDVAAWYVAWAEVLGGDTQMRVMPPNAAAIYRRTPEQRRAYLTDHRDEALANGIPADLIDMMIADAEADGSDD